MTPSMLMLIGAIVLILAVLAVGRNFAGMWRDPDRLLEKKSIMIHLWGGLVAGISVLAIIGGFIWFLVEKYASG